MKALILFLSVFSMTSVAMAKSPFCQKAVLKQARAQLSKTQKFDQITVESSSMGETFHSFVLKTHSATSGGRKLTELFDAKVDSDCIITELTAQPDSQRTE